VAVVASFDGPGRALRCAADIRQAAAQQDIQVRIGVHTGEVEILNEEVTGVSLDIAEMLAGVAEPTEILVTKTVRDLVVGSGITFVDRGSHRLGLTDEYRLFALTER
jgi:class 3 adenylate cyclase